VFLKVLLKTKAEHEQAMETVFRSADELLHEKEAQYSQSLTEALAQCDAKHSGAVENALADANTSSDFASIRTCALLRIFQHVQMLFTVFCAAASARSFALWKSAMLRTRELGVVLGRFSRRGDCRQLKQAWSSWSCATSRHHAVSKVLGHLAHHSSKTSLFRALSLWKQFLWRIRDEESQAIYVARLVSVRQDAFEEATHEIHAIQTRHMHSQQVSHVSRLVRRWMRLQLQTGFLSWRSRTCLGRKTANSQRPFSIGKFAPCKIVLERLMATKLAARSAALARIAATNGFAHSKPRRVAASSILPSRTKRVGTPKSWPPDSSEQPDMPATTLGLIAPAQVRQIDLYDIRIRVLAATVIRTVVIRWTRECVRGAWYHWCRGHQEFARSTRSIVVYLKRKISSVERSALMLWSSYVKRERQWVLTRLCFSCQRRYHTKMRHAFTVWVATVMAILRRRARIRHRGGADALTEQEHVNADAGSGSDHDNMSVGSSVGSIDSWEGPPTDFPMSFSAFHIKQ
jgi:hypothetical protein